jgi:hypothetical protein
MPGHSDRDVPAHVSGRIRTRGRRRGSRNCGDGVRSRVPRAHGGIYDASMAKSSLDLQALALLGARQRLTELDEERAAILRAFPQLRVASRGRQAAEGNDADTAVNGTGPSPRKRRKMSAEARRRISEAMKARWAKQKSKKTAAKSA